MTQVPFSEGDCTITLEGRNFTSGGAFLTPCSDGFMRGAVYAKPGIVTDWHGKEIAKARYGRIYQGNFCRMQSVTFELDGLRYAGRFCPDWSELVRVRSTKRIS